MFSFRCSFSLAQISLQFQVGLFLRVFPCLDFRMTTVWFVLPFSLLLLLLFLGLMWVCCHATCVASMLLSFNDPLSQDHSNSSVRMFVRPSFAVFPMGNAPEIHFRATKMNVDIFFTG